MGRTFSALKDEGVIRCCLHRVGRTQTSDQRKKFIQAERKKPKIESVPFPAKIRRRIFQPEDERSVIMGIEFSEMYQCRTSIDAKDSKNLERILMQQHRRSLSKDGL